MEIKEAKIVRELAYKLIFSSLFADKEKNFELKFWYFDEDESLMFNENEINFYLEDNCKNNITEEMKNKLYQYLTFYISSLTENNMLISKYLKANFNFDKLIKTDLAVLYLALIELRNFKDLDDKIIINEAIEISKKFSNDKSYKFINGILGNLVKEIRK